VILFTIIYFSMWLLDTGTLVDAEFLITLWKVWLRIIAK